MSLLPGWPRGTAGDTVTRVGTQMPPASAQPAPAGAAVTGHGNDREFTQEHPVHRCAEAPAARAAATRTSTRSAHAWAHDFHASTRSAHARSYPWFTDEGPINPCANTPLAHATRGSTQLAPARAPGRRDPRRSWDTRLGDRGAELGQPRAPSQPAPACRPRPPPTGQAQHPARGGGLQPSAGVGRGSVG